MKNHERSRRYGPDGLDFQKAQCRPLDSSVISSKTIPGIRAVRPLPQLTARLLDDALQFAVALSEHRQRIGLLLAPCGIRRERAFRNGVRHVLQVLPASVGIGRTIEHLRYRFERGRGGSLVLLLLGIQQLLNRKRGWRSKGCSPSY